MYLQVLYALDAEQGGLCYGTQVFAGKEGKEGKRCVLCVGEGGVGRIKK